MAGQAGLFDVDDRLQRLRDLGDQLEAFGSAVEDRDARWTVKFTRAKPREDGTQPAVDLAIPAFG
jgi:hypothetical protein